MKNFLESLIENNRQYVEHGKLASYIPELEKANKEDLGIYIVTLDGKEVGAGEYDKKFTIQSISKVITLMLAILDNGKDRVFSRVGVEPTGDSFNSIVSLERKPSKKPFNPMVNSGAILTTSLIEGDSEEEKFERILEFTRKVTGNDDIQLNEDVYLSEKETGDRNRALAYFMKSNGVIEGNIDDILDAKDLARFGAMLANDGVLPWNGERVISREICRIIKTIMVTCGMYDDSGKFAVHIGIPAKSGVGGGIMAAVPRRMGIGIFGPSLDDKGNSIAGTHVMKDLSEELDLSIF